MTRESDPGDSLECLLESLATSSDTVGSTYWIQVTYIRTPHSFYVRPTVYNKFLTALHSPGAKIEAKDMYRGNVVIVKSKTNKSFIRGRIISIVKPEENMSLRLKIFAMDYGNIETYISCRNMYKPLDPLSSNVPALAKHCQLQLCEPLYSKWNVQSINAMKYYIGYEKTRLVVRNVSNRLLTVTIHNSCHKDISTMLGQLGYTTFGPSGSMQQFYAPKQAKYSYAKLKPNDILKVRIQSGINVQQFYVAEVNSYKRYLKERPSVAAYARQADVLSPEEICVGKPVCVPTAKRYRYERGIIKKVYEPNSMASVQLVDWGDVLQVPFHKIKPIQDSLLSFNAVAICCETAQGINIWGPTLRNILFPDYTLIIKIKSVAISLNAPNYIQVFKRK